MRRPVVTLLLALPLVLTNATTPLENATIKPDSGIVTASLLSYRENDLFKKMLTLPPSSGLTISITDAANFPFIVLQIHTYQYNVTLAYDKALLDKVSKKSLFGSNIGLYLKTRDVTDPMQMFLKNDNVHTLDALLVIVPYGPNAPIPGGCNMEFEIEIAPYQMLRIENEMIIVDAQPAAVFAANGSTISCEKNPVQHRMYRLQLGMQEFTEDLKSYFDAIASMLTARDIAQNGTEIPPAYSISSMRRMYSMYAGTGFVYAVIATYGNYSSAYVPTFSYGCNPVLRPKSCQILNGAFPKVVCAIVLFIGFLSVFIGHKPKYARVDRLLADCALGSFVGYTFAVGVADSGTTIDVLIGLLSAILITCVSPCVRIRGLRNPLVLLLSNLPLAFLCGCIAYLFAPVKIHYVLEYNLSFWTIFVTLVLALAVLLMTTFQVGEIITRAVFGSFLLIIALDYYSNTNLKYIIITIIRRITIPEFHLAFVYPPVQDEDIALICIWIILIVLRFCRICRAQISEPSLSVPGEMQSLLDQS